MIMAAQKNFCVLMRYKAWADALLYRTVSRLPEEELTKPQKIVFGSMLRTLNHVHAMDLVWRAHLQGKPHGLTSRNPEVCPPFAELRAAQEQMDQWFIRYAEGVADSALDEVVRFEFIGGGAGAMSRGDVLLHVVNHTTYHRGHLADMIYQIPGAHPPTTDLPVFLRVADSAEL
jgi:uncharacterized damage-inducible protein DinB